MEGSALGDVELVGLASGGDVEGLAALLERHRPALYAAATAMLRDRHEAHDAVQETFVVAMLRLGSLRDPARVGAWLHRICRNTCLMRLRRHRRQQPIERPGAHLQVPSAEQALEELALRDWVWTAIDSLAPDDRVAVMLRYFSRCQTYEAIATVTGCPVGTVRSRLHRSRSQLSDRLLRTVAGSSLSHAALERRQRAQWEGFYGELHNAPVPSTYRNNYSTDVEVTDGAGTWQGVADWSAHEREAIDLGVRATVVGVVASKDLTVLEIDFTNPAWAADHCPPRSTFVHRLSSGRSQRVHIHYV